MTEVNKGNDSGVIEREIATCQTAQDVARLLQNSLLPEGDELFEEALDMVAGGMPEGAAVSIIATAYWDLCILGRKNTRYSTSLILEAAEVCGISAAGNQGLAYKMIQSLANHTSAALIHNTIN